MAGIKAPRHGWVAFTSSSSGRRFWFDFVNRIYSFKRPKNDGKYLPLLEKPTDVIPVPPPGTFILVNCVLWLCVFLQKSV